MYSKEKFLLASCVVWFAAACSSTEKKTETPQPVVAEAAQPPKKEEPAAAPPQVQARSVESGTSVDAVNDKLSKASVLGLPAYASTIQESDAKAALEIIKAVTDEMPVGYVLQITGHANKHPDPAKRTSIALSEQRAKSVYDYFVKNSIAKDKLTYRGVGSSEYDEKLSRDQNRRITFKLIKQ